MQVRLENPHSWLFLDVKDPGGKVVRWAFEAGTPSGMVRNGFKPGIIKKGVEVTIKGFHAKDPTQNMGMLRELVLADGTTYGMFGSQQGPADDTPSPRGNRHCRIRPHARVVRTRHGECGGRAGRHQPARGTRTANG